MFFLKSSKNQIDPSCFLDAFSHFMVSMERGDFVVNSRQDVPEVLNYVLDNFCGVSVLAQAQIKVLLPVFLSASHYFVAILNIALRH